LLIVLAAGTAHAQPAAQDDPIEVAKQLYAEGKRYYDIADYAHAIASWKRAYVASNAPMLLFNIAQAYRLSGNCDEALHVYAAYERAAPDLTNRDDLEQAKGRCNREPTKTHPPAPEPAVGAPRSAPASTPAPVGIPPALNESHEHRNLRIAGIATASVGVVLGVTSFVFARHASSAADQVAAHRGEWTATERALEREGHRDATISIATGIAGGAAIVGGVALYYLGRESARRVDVAVAPTHAEVVWSVSF
jgi:tetratricopeptide (TPR) repeat protein